MFYEIFNSMFAVKKFECGIGETEEEKFQHVLPSINRLESYHLNWVVQICGKNNSAQIDLIIKLLKSKLTDKKDFHKKLVASVTKNLGPEASKDDVNLSIHYVAKYDLYESLDLVQLGKYFAEENKIDELQSLLGKKSPCKEELRKSTFT